MKFLFLAIFFLSYSVAHAQNQKSAIAYRISYQKNLPRAVSKLMPQGTESYFFGKFRPQQDGEQYAVHLFGAASPPEDPDKRFPGKQKFILDIFQISHSEYERINRVPLNFLPTWAGYSRFGCQWFWADARKTDVPVLQFGMWDTEGIYGNIGDEVYVAFKDGLNQTPSIRTLQFGAWRASDTLGERNSVKGAEDGMSEIHIRLYPNTDVPDPDHVALTLKWDGENFVSAKPLDDYWRRYVR